MKDMEDNISEERKNMESNLYMQIKNSEAIIRELREAKASSDGLILKYKNNIENLNLKIKELELKHKKIIEIKENKSNDLELEINNYKIKLSQITNDIFLKDSTIKKMNGEIQILKSELANIKNNNNDLLNKNEIFIYCYNCRTNTGKMIKRWEYLI
jgi:chromosome segregation ATPase